MQAAWPGLREHVEAVYGGIGKVDGAERSGG